MPHNDTEPLDTSLLNLRDDSPFGFRPTLWVCILFVCLFALTGTAHLAQTIRYRTWWWIPTLVTCGFVEVIGWAGRLWGHSDPWTMNPYLMQICCTIFAPSFMTAAMFIIFVKIIVKIGPEYSRLTPKLYTYLFVGVDTVALVIQSIGGAQAAQALTPKNAQKGARVMVGGIIVQMAAIAIYALVSVEYFWRVYTDKPIRRVQQDNPMYNAPTLSATATVNGSSDVTTEKEKATAAPPPTQVPAPRGRAGLTRNVKLMVLGLILATTLVIVRSIYRTIEVSTRLFSLRYFPANKPFWHRFSCSTDGVDQSLRTKRYSTVWTASPSSSPCSRSMSSIPAVSSPPSDL
ncbi:hypothetical protein FRB95_007094 [Tulasnella sp. JGI-2019a]|nr:hypothetical protein FRB95_007094 [Tulasnella sp. JGI-2019a]